MRDKHTIINYLDSDASNKNPFVNSTSGIIFREDLTGKTYLQLKLENLIDEELESVSIKIFCISLDKEVLFLEENVGDYTFEDINLDGNNNFGSDVAIDLNLSNIHKVRVHIYNIVTKSGKQYHIFSNISERINRYIIDMEKEIEDSKKKIENRFLKKSYTNLKSIISRDSFKKKFKKYSVICLCSFIAIALISTSSYYIIKEVNYSSGLKYYNLGDYEKAIDKFENLNYYKDTENLKKMSIKKANIMSSKIKFKDIFSYGIDNLMGVRTDGRVLFYGAESHPKSAVQDWRDIISVACGDNYTVGLKKDGTVIGVGENKFSQVDVSSWSDIDSIYTGGYHTVGLKKDGTVVATGDNYANQTDISSWNNIVDITAGLSHTVGLKEDGTVLAVGSNYYGQLEVSSWTNIVKVVAGRYHTVGLKKDGTVVATGYSSHHQLEVSSWTNISDIAAGHYSTIAITHDGEIINTNDGFSTISFDTKEWNDLVTVFANAQSVVGIKSDGSIIGYHIGPGYYGYLDKLGWSDIGKS